MLNSCDFINNKLFGKKERILAEMKAKADSLRVADSLRNLFEINEAIENERLDSIRKAEEERRASESKYNIIVGSFITSAYAKQLSEEYTKMGYKTRLLKPEGSRFEFVAAEGHKSFSEAARRLDMFKDTVQVESWIYINK